MKIEIELTEEQDQELEQVRGAIAGSGAFVIPAQIKIKNWDNSQTKSKVVGRVLTGEDATEIVRIINNFMREYKKRESDSTQKKIDI